MNKYIEIIEYKTNKVISRFDVTGKNERMIDKFDSGLNINLNHSEYYTSINETKRKLKTK